MAEQTATPVVSQRKDPDIELVDKLVRESEKRRNETFAGGISIAELAQRNGARFLGDHVSQWHGLGTKGANSLLNEEGFKMPPDSTGDTPGVVRVQLNRTSTSVVATTSAITESPVEITFHPVETGDPWQYTLKPKAARKLALMRDNPAFAQANQVLGTLVQDELHGFTTDQLNGEAFIDDARAEWLMENLTDPKTGEPLLGEDDFFIVNDDQRAEIAKIIFDNRWHASNCDYFIIEHALYFSIFGFQPMRYQWDTHGQKHILENIHGLSLWPDPLHTLIDNWDYSVFEFYVPLEKAVSIWPQYESEFRNAAEEGKLVKAEGVTIYPSNYEDHEYERRMVQVRIAWIKHEQVPMRLNEALNLGAVVETEGGYAVATDGAETAPGAENWPETRGIKQIQILPQVNKKISSRRCPYLYEPLLWTVNIPIMYSPWGVGEPYRLEDIQMSINVELTTIINHHRFSAYPAEFWPADLYNRLVSKGFKPFVRPGRQVPIPRADYDRMTAQGRIGFTQDPPVLSSDKVAVLELLLREHDKLSGNVEALQGRTPGSRTSGVLFQQLRAEARGPLGLKAKFLQMTTKRLAELMMDAITKWMTPQMWKMILSRFPQHVIDEYRRTIRSDTLNVQAAVTNSGGLLEQQKREESRALYGMQAIDRIETLKDHKRDPDPINRRVEAEQRRAMAMQVAAAEDGKSGGGDEGILEQGER